jgi:serine/threonine protein kinase
MSGTGGTRRESPRSFTPREGGVAPTTRLNLPAELAERYSPLEELDSGSEAFVLLVENAERAKFVVKLYHRRLTFDETAMSLLGASKSARVVKVLEDGWAVDNGARYEVLEWCPQGSLRDLLERQTRLDIVAVVAQLNNALIDVHDLRLPNENARLVHQDLKPENVMVRSLFPLDLAVGDFGLVRVIAGSRHYTNRQQGSRAFAPPSGEAISIGWDYWSLGMVIVEVASGQHPFRVDGQWLQDSVISDLLSQGSVDVSRITDSRVRTLCRGLLTRRTVDRWGAKEVAKWLDGEDMFVATDLYREGAQERSVLFGGVEYSGPSELALALQNDWDRAQEQLIQRTDGGVLSQQVGLLLGACGMADSQQLLADTANPPTRLANLLLSLNPDLPPIYKGKDIRPEAISAGLSDSATAAQYIDLLEDNRSGLVHTGVLTCWRTLEGMSTGPAIETRIREAFDYLQQHGRLVDAHLNSDGRRHLKTATYAVAVNLGSGSAARNYLQETDSTLANRQTWWAALASEPNDFAPILALHTEHAAREQTNEEEARVEAEKKKREQIEKEVARAEASAREAQYRQRQTSYQELKKKKLEPVRSSLFAVAFLAIAGLWVILAFRVLKGTSRWELPVAIINVLGYIPAMCALAYLIFYGWWASILALWWLANNPEPRGPF